MGRITARRKVTRVDVAAGSTGRIETLAVEEPLEIRIAGNPLTVTMRTPGHDVELAAGFLLAESIISRTEQFRSAMHCGGTGSTAVGGSTITAPAVNHYNVLDVTLAGDGALVAPHAARNFAITSACGICGKASVDAVETVSSFDVSGDPIRIDAADLAQYPDRLRAGQDVFEKTGGLHAAALFDVDSGELLVLREDVGRHNAVDKVIGWALMHDRVPLRGTVLQVSGRASFELVQKAAMAGIPILAAVSAPSSLAVELAERVGITLVGFLRGASMNVYTRDERIRTASPAAANR